MGMMFAVTGHDAPTRTLGIFPSTMITPGSLPDGGYIPK